MIKFDFSIPACKRSSFCVTTVQNKNAPLPVSEANVQGEALAEELSSCSPFPVSEANAQGKGVGG